MRCNRVVIPVEFEENTVSSPKSELYQAIKDKSYVKTKSLLDVVTSDEDRMVVKAGIEFLASQKKVAAIKKLYLINEIKDNFGMNNNDMRNFIFSIIKIIIDVSWSSEDVLEFEAALEKMEESQPYLRLCTSPRDKFASRQWEGQEVSQVWAQIIDYTKAKIRIFSNNENNGVLDAKAFAFLSTPTHRSSVAKVNNSESLATSLLREDSVREQNCCIVM